MSNVNVNVLVILLSAAVVSAFYAFILERLHATYSPDYTWLTVVIGNALVGGAMACLCMIDEVPWRAFGYLVAINVAMGVPIIVWQIGQGDARQKVRAGRNGHGEQHDGTTHQER